MNRRSFLLKSAMAAFGFSILPGAGRIWKAQRKWISNVPLDRLTIEYLDKHIAGLLPAREGIMINGKECWLSPSPLRFKLKNGVYELDTIPIESEPHYDPNYT